MTDTVKQRGVVRLLVVALTAVIAVLGTADPADAQQDAYQQCMDCLLYTSPSPRDS